MFDDGAFVLAFDVGHRVGAASVADEERIALGEVPRPFGLGRYADQSPVGLIGAAGGNALGDDPRRRVFAQMDHLGAGVGLLVVVGDGDGIEFPHRVVAFQDAARVLPGDGCTRFHLGPGNLRIAAPAVATLGDEVEDTATAVLVAGVPVLDGRVLDLGVVQRDQFDNGGVKLVLVTHRRRAAFQIGHIGPLVGDDQRALELSGVRGVDAEIGAELHRAAHAWRDVDERAVGEHRRIQRRVLVVRIGDHGAQILLDQIRAALEGLGDGAKDDADFPQLGLEGGGHGNAVEHGVDGDPGQPLLLLQGNAQLLVSLQQLGVDFVEALRTVGGAFWRRIVIRVLIIDGLVDDLGPFRLRHRQPVPIRLQPPFQQPFGLVLLDRNEAHDVFVQALGRGLGLDVGEEAVLVLLFRQFLDLLDRIY